MVSLGDKSLKLGMNKQDFTEYLAAWENRADSLGAQRKSTEELKEKEYAISMKTDHFVDSVFISMGPTRRTSKGAIWGDGWSIYFTTDTTLNRLKRRRAGMLGSISAFRDEFNTMGR
jgi:hypothetical protein